MFSKALKITRLFYDATLFSIGDWKRNIVKKMETKLNFVVTNNKVIKFTPRKTKPNRKEINNKITKIKKISSLKDICYK